MRRITTLLFLTAALLRGAAAQAGADEVPAPRDEPLQVVATIPDLADLAETIGGAAVEVKVLVPAGTDPHGLLPKASLLLKLQRADVLLLMGLDYEHAFLPALLEKIDNERVRPGGGGYVNVGARIRPLDVPESLDRGAGADLHPRGNPHFNCDPERGRVMAMAVRDALTAADPGRAADFRRRWEAWDDRAAARLALWEDYLQPLAGKPLVCYHKSWTYFAERFQLQELDQVEPKPGLRPTPRHLADLATSMRRQEARVLLMEPWYPRSDVEKLLQLTGAELVVVPTTCGATRGTEHYLDWLDHVVDAIGRAYGRPALAEFERQRKEAPRS